MNAQTSGRGPHVGQIYDGHYSALRRYFMKHLGDASEADACVRDTFRRFFDSMKGGRFEDVRPYARARLMRAAFAVCTERSERLRLAHESSAA